MISSNLLDLSKYIDLNLPYESSVLKWTRGWDGSQGSFITPPCFSLLQFVKKMYGEKVSYEINDFSKLDGSIKITITDPQSGEMMYLYELFVTPDRSYTNDTLI